MTTPEAEDSPPTLAERLREHRHTTSGGDIWFDAGVQLIIHELETRESSSASALEAKQERTGGEALERLAEIGNWINETDELRLFSKAYLLVQLNRVAEISRESQEERKAE